MVTQLEPATLQCEVKWTLGSITMNKASGGDGILPELFQILKDDGVKVLHSKKKKKCCTYYASKSGKVSSGYRKGKEKVSFHFNPKKKAKQKNVQNTT